ncbi:MULTISPECIES: ketoacyl-ACP synthase III family protein [unclassified Streptomyces]|uniref:ketoacyl-ACP synthase III family protein n=1 Tax=unclassified Streptomyces TaxID=2593676 RepID=UPI00278BB713|nr:MULTISPECIES: ketoacyl-ACP synthase III family protein [unclassified Streptomyces]
MRWNDICIAGLGTRLPSPQPAEPAVREDRYSSQEYKDNELVSVLVGDGEPAVDMAVVAGRQALARSGRPAEDIGLLLHAHTYHQGEDLWTPATYVQQHTVGGDAPSVALNQACDGGMVSLHLAVPHLLAGTASAALLTTGDRFCSPGFDRWSSDLGLAFGDGGTAMVAARGEGVARILATHSSSDPSFEALYRDTERGFTDAPHLAGTPLDLRRRKLRFVRQEGVDSVMERLAKGLVANVEQVLDEAGVSMDQMARLVLPNLGKPLLSWQLLAPLKIDPARTVWEWGRRTGHLGAGDQCAGLTYLFESGQLRRGDLVLLVGVGIGYCWTTAVLQVQGVPDWSGPDAETLRVAG